MGGSTQNVPKPPPGKNVPKSQGQIFQECVECQEFQECQGQIFQEFVECVECVECENGKFSKNLWKIIFENFVI